MNKKKEYNFPILPIVLVRHGSDYFFMENVKIRHGKEDEVYCIYFNDRPVYRVRDEYSYELFLGFLEEYIEEQKNSCFIYIDLNQLYSDACPYF